MKDGSAHDPGRRFFLTTVAPACALACFGAKDLFALTQSDAKQTAQQAPHKFDSDLERKLTLRQHFDNRFREYIQLAKALEAEWGKDRTTEFLKKTTTKKLTDYGKRQASQVSDNSFETYVSQFRSGFDKVLTLEIVEDTNTAFELKVTECIWADTFLRADVGHIGYCSVCWGDYAWAESFNNKIQLVRDKTLMEGHDCCNHRYIWKG
ncbi:MAG: hypothetical protein GTO29_14870 [Candidatus Latescibacteria bacterium]|nr:hypothetical protein [Candidatus Latescibacterota bacterium]NIO57433.1 hypothetical protein [Candidatus Latescibacterota bacterium]